MYLVLVWDCVIITLDLAKNDNAVETVLSPTVLDETPLPIWLLLGLMLEELPTFALSTDAFAAREDTSPKELIEVKLEDVPTQLTTKELKRLEKLSTTDSFAKKILNKLVLVSTTRGSTV